MGKKKFVPPTITGFGMAGGTNFFGSAVRATTPARRAGARPGVQGTSRGPGAANSRVIGPGCSPVARYQASESRAFRCGVSTKCERNRAARRRLEELPRVPTGTLGTETLRTMFMKMLGELVIFYIP